MAGEPRFLVDINVGRLAKWLRIMGFDVLYPGDVSDGELVRRAMVEGRVLLTRDSRIPERRVAKNGLLQVLLVRGDGLREQLRFVTEALGLEMDGREGSLCIRCNVALQPRDKESARGQVPPYVFANQERFMECPSCRKLYWQGTHWQHMMEELERLQGRGL